MRSLGVPVDRVLAGCAGSIAAAVLVAGQIGAERIVQTVLGAPPMAYSTAVAIATCGLAVASRRAWRIAGTATIIIAGLTVAGYATSRPLALEALGWLGVRTAVRGDIGSVMAPNTALSLLLIGTSLVLFAPARRPMWTTHTTAILLTTSAALPIVAGFGYFAGVPGAYAWGEFKPMEPHTAAALVALAIGTLWHVSRVAWLSVGRSAPGWLPVPIVLMIAAIGLLLSSALRAEEIAARRREADRAVAACADRLQSEVGDYVRMASRLAARVGRGETPGSALWETDVADLKRDFVGLERVRYRPDRQTASAPARFSVDGETLVLDVPVPGPSTARGDVVLTFAIVPLFTNVADTTDATIVTVEHAGRRLFGSAALGADPIAKPLPALGEGWRVVAAQPAAATSPLPSVVLTSVLALAMFAGVVSWLARSMDARRRQSVEATRVLNLVLETLPVGVFIADRQGLLTSNPEGKRIWGAAPQVGPEQYGIFHAWRPDTGERLSADEWGMAKALRSGEATLNEVLEIVAFDGGRKTIQHSAVPIREVDGSIVGGVVVVQDVTARIRNERLLADRTRELERSNAELAQFAYVASHDLQEPLRMVSSYTQLLARRYKGRLDASADEFIHFAVDGAQRMQQLIDALLQFSRVGTQGAHFEPFNIEDALAAAVNNLGVMIREQQATVTHDRLPRITGDKLQLTQLFQNLIANAIKFRSDEPPRVHVGVRGGPEAPVFSVEDNGIGIDPQFSERVFVMFQRLHPREQYPGTGIGLALCRKIVARHGGTIWVEPGDGHKGSAFRFTLNAKAAQSAA